MPQVEEVKENQNPYIRWSTFDVIKNHAAFLCEEDPGLSEGEAFEKAASDPEIFSFEWEWLLESLQEKLEEYNEKGKPWHILGVGLGWRNLDGEMILETNNSQEFLEKILPNCDCTFNIYTSDDDRRISIQNFHHDSPTGEWYYVAVAQSLDLI